MLLVYRIIRVFLRKIADDELERGLAAHIWQPLLVTLDGVILNGWRRYRIAKKLGLKCVPVVIIHGNVEEVEIDTLVPPGVSNSLSSTGDTRMPVLELEFEVYCSCGNGLCRQTTEGQTVGRGMPFITVEPCKNCVDAARAEGYSEGYDQGWLDVEEEDKDNDDSKT